MISTCSRSAPARAASPARAAPAPMARASRSARSCASAAPACCAAACRRSSWSMARNSPTPSPTPPASAGPCRRRRFDWPSLIAAKDKEIDRLSQIYLNMLNNSERRDHRGARRRRRSAYGRGRRPALHRRQHHDRGRRLAGDARHSRHRACHLVERGARPARRCRAASSSSAAAISRSSSPASSTASAREVVEIIRREELLRGFDDDVRVDLGPGDARARHRHPRPHPDRPHRQDRRAATSSPPRTAQEISTDLVMYATGRKPNTTRPRPRRDRRRDERRTARSMVDEWQRSTVPNIYAVGDVTDRHQPDPGRDRRGPRHRRDALQQQSDQDGPRRRADRRVQPAADRHGRA